MDVVLYQPEIPDNTAALIRLGACLGYRLHLIEPLGFALDTKKMRRIGMDYSKQITLIRHPSWDHFRNEHPDARLVLATTKAQIPHWHHRWAKNDFLIMGQESAGVPTDLHEQVNVQITIPMAQKVRSLNLASAATVICGEWQRQISETNGISLL